MCVCERYIRGGDVLTECVFPPDSGPSGESCGFRADTEACESPHLPPGATAAENTGSAERHANW